MKDNSILKNAHLKLEKMKLELILLEKVKVVLNEIGYDQMTQESKNLIREMLRSENIFTGDPESNNDYYPCSDRDEY
jgi:hypothetical protein